MRKLLSSVCIMSTFGAALMLAPGFADQSSDAQGMQQRIQALVLEKYDANGNGELDPEEVEVLKQDNDAFLEQVRQRLLARLDGKQSPRATAEFHAARGAASDTSAFCDGTPDGAVVDPETGCTIAELCPCEGVAGVPALWPDHRRYALCVAHVSRDFTDRRLITEEERTTIVREAIESDCGNSQ